MPSDVGEPDWTLSANIAHSLQGLHALSGCDTVSHLQGIVTAVCILLSDNSLALLGMYDATMDEAISETTSFKAKCYGAKCNKDMLEIHLGVWSKIARQKISNTLKLKSLPPTSAV